MLGRVLSVFQAYFGNLRWRVSGGELPLLAISLPKGSLDAALLHVLIIDKVGVEGIGIAEVLILLVTVLISARLVFFLL